MASSGGSAERYRYLSLGFFAQRVVSALIEFVEEGKTQGLPDTLAEAIGYLGSVDQVQPDSGARAFRSYQEMRTLEDVSTPGDRASLVRSLTELRDQLTNQSTVDLSTGIDAAIAWFAELQNEALRNYSDASEPVPRELRELCETR